MHKQQNGHIEMFCSLVAFLSVSIAKPAISCMNQALPFGLCIKRKIDKLSKWESQSPADRSPPTTRKGLKAERVA
jgi:hypothetical protein